VDIYSRRKVASKALISLILRSATVIVGSSKPERSVAHPCSRAMARVRQRMKTGSEGLGEYNFIASLRGYRIK
jgi:hypothetical protein